MTRGRACGAAALASSVVYATAIIKNDAYAINAQARHLKTVLYDHRLGDGHEHSRADDAAF